MLAAAWTAASAALLVSVVAVVAMWVRLQTRLSVLDARLEAIEGTVRRIEDAVWVQAGIAILPGGTRPVRGP